MRDTPSGITLRARSSGGRWSVALKLYGRDGAGRATRCLDQHRRRPRPSAGQPRLRRPRAARCARRPAGLRHALRRRPLRRGDPAPDLFHRQRTSERLLDRAARWLRAYHLASGLHPAPLAPGPFLANLQRRLDPDRTSRHRRPRRLRRPPRPPARDASPRPPPALPGRGRPRRLQPAEPDLRRPGHLVDRLQPRRVAHPVPVTADVACCLFFLEFRDRWRVGTRAGSPGGHDARAIAIFAEAYPELPWNSLEAAWLLQQQTLRYWAGPHAHRTPTAPSASSPPPRPAPRRCATAPPLQHGARSD